MAFNFGTNNGPSTGNNMFGGFNNGTLNTGMFGTQTVQPNNLQVLSTTSREFAENYNVSPGHTIVFINYNGRRLYIKTQNQNGLSYEMEELIILRPEEFQQLQQQALTNQAQRPEQQTHLAKEGASYVPRNEYNMFLEKYNALAESFEDLKQRFEEFIK